MLSSAERTLDLPILKTCHSQDKVNAMPERCVIGKDLAPPVWEVHHVRLVNKQLPEGTITPGKRAFIYLASPMSGKVLDDPAMHE
jgi:hypothetical protein